jgi:hypothetical protein
VNHDGGGQMLDGSVRRFGHRIGILSISIVSGCELEQFKASMHAKMAAPGSAKQ